MKILYISSAASRTEFPKMQKFYHEKENSLYGMPEASFRFHNLIIEGLASNGAEVYSLIGRPVSHSNYKKVFWGAKRTKDKNVIYHHVSIINLPIIKQFYVSIVMLFNIMCWLIKNLNDKDKTIIYDGAYVTLIPIISFCTLIFSCNKVPIICDIYGYMADVDDARMNRNLINKIVSKFISFCLSKMQGFVFLTEQMNEVLNHNRKPYLVMEGISEYQITKSSSDIKNKFIIMYAGALKEEYGLKNLVNGFMKFKKDDAELWICGAGNYSETIIKKAKKDPRIKFFGHMTMEEVQQKEKEATILVNPRPTNFQFTKYSFPSKTMEYMASGTPILTTKLPGIPKEYEKYIYTIDGNGEKDIVDALNKLSHISFEELNKKGQKAQKFIEEHKNKKAQSSKILDFCKSLLKKRTGTIKKSNLLNLYFTCLMISYILLSRNTLWSSVIFTTRLSAIYLILLSLPLFFIYFKRLIKKEVSISNFSLFSVLIVSILISLIVKSDFIAFNFNFLLTLCSCFVFSQLYEDKEQFKKLFIIIIAGLSVCSLINQYVIKQILIDTEIFNNINGNFWIVKNANNTTFINMITSFVIYRSDYIRNFGIFNEPSFYQFYIMIALLFLDDIKINKKNKLALYMVFILTMLSTMSTVGYMLLILYTLLNIKNIIIYIKKIITGDSNKSKFILLLGVIVIFVGGIYLLSSSKFVSDFKFIFTKLFIPNNSSSTRMDSLVFTLQNILKHPLLGVNSAFYLDAYLTTNTNASIWAMYGIIPAFCLIIYTIILSFKRKNNWKENMLIFLILLLSMNSHFFLNNFSFWIIIFSGIMREKDEYLN